MIWHDPRFRVYKDTLTKQDIPRAQRFTQELVNDQCFLWNVQGWSTQACWVSHVTAQATTWLALGDRGLVLVSIKFEKILLVLRIGNPWCCCGLVPGWSDHKGFQPWQILWEVQPSPQTQAGEESRVPTRRLSHGDCPSSVLCLHHHIPSETV